MRPSATVRFAACVLSALGLGGLPSGAETIRSRDLEITVLKEGCGLVDEVRYRGETVMSTTTCGHSPAPGFAADEARARRRALLAAALKKLDANAPCKVSESTSPRGHKLITLENGLLRVVAMTWFGGRILRLESKLTGGNLLDNPYEDRPDEVTKPDDIGGIWGELPSKILQVKFTRRNADEIALLMSAEGDDMRIEKTLRLRRGSAVLEIEQRHINGGRARSATNHLFGRYRVGGAVGPEDVLWGSSRGAAVFLRKTRSSPSCFTDPATDHWAAIHDATEGTALVTTFAGPVTRVGTWVRENFYQLEHRTPRHFTLAAGEEMTTRLRVATCHNTSGVAFADGELAVGIAGRCEVVPAGSGAWTTSVSAAGFINGPARKLTLRAHVTDRHGKTVKRLRPVTVDCPFLVAEPRLVRWPMSGVPAGFHNVHVTVAEGRKVLGRTTLAIRRLGAGPILELLRPAKAQADTVVSLPGSVERGKVSVTSVVKVDDRTIRVRGEHVHSDSRSPFVAEVRLNEAGDGFCVRHTLVCNADPATWRVRAAGLALPLVLGNDYHRVRTIVGAGKLTDAWRVDQTDESAHTSTISDWFSRWPRWRLGGVCQDAPTHYSIWKASDWDVAPMTTLHGRKAPGWVEVNNGRRGIRIEMEEMAGKAPKAIVVDGHAGMALAYFYPPYVPPVRLAGSGDPSAPSLAERLRWSRGAPWTNSVSIRFHNGPHVRGFKREIPDKAFRAALEALGERAVVGSVRAVAVPGGTFEECMQNILDSDISFRTYVFRAVRSGYRLRGLCRKFGSAYTEDFDRTLAGLIEALRERYK